MRALSVMPIGISTNPVLFTLPAKANILVPLLPAVPMDANHSAPLFIIRGKFAHVSTLFSLIHCYLHILYCQRILLTNIDESLMGTHGIRTYHKTFKDTMRVPFHQGAIHESARVTFVAVNDNILRFSRRVSCGLPFPSCGKAASTT